MGKFFKTAESNYVLDFLAGADPTGRATLELSKKNTKNHIGHRISGDVGGFIAGSAATTALTAGTMAIGSKLVKKNPALAKVLQETARDSMIVLKPKKAISSIKNLSESYGLVNQDLKNVDKLRNLQKEYPELAKSMKDISSNNGKVGFSDLLGLHSAINDEKLKAELKTLQGSMNAHEEKIKNFKNRTGQSHIDAAQQGAAAVAGLAAAGVGGTLNAVSAESQYQVGQEIRKKK